MEKTKKKLDAWQEFRTSPKYYAKRIRMRNNLKNFLLGLFRFIIIVGIYMPAMSYTHASYFIIRAGGNTFITFLFDSCFVWVIAVPLAYVLSRYTAVSVQMLMILVMGTEFIKCIIGGVMVKSGMWAKNIVS